MSNIMSILVDLIKNGSLVQLLVAIMLVATDCYLVITAGVIPETVANMTLLVLGFYFGSHTQSIVGTKKE